MKNKFSMPQKDNVFFAKRLLVDAIYKSANLEGIAVTFAQTSDILNDVNVQNVKPSEISKVFCLRDAWQYVLENINADINLGFLENIHELVAKADVPYYELGKLRTNDVMISGTRWRPELPNAEKLHIELEEIKKIKNATDKAITSMLWVMRCQMFKDGNKRVGNLIANKILIENGNGIISVPVELDGEFKTRLVKYYESNDMSELKKWVYDNCIDGVNIKNPVQDFQCFYDEQNSLSVDDELEK